MQVSSISIDLFLDKARSLPVLDVRSEKEFTRGHIPGALNLPLLDDTERAIIGTLYVQQGRESAVEKGFELVGGKFHLKIKEASRLINGKECLIHCLRGGLRSNIMAWLLSMAGFRVYLLKDGYKSFRHQVLQILSRPKNLVVIGGYTGSGKTDLLKTLQTAGSKILDLEDLCNHRGSAFGTLGMSDQPTNEQFENNLALIWQSFDNEEPVFAEDESRMIGSIKIPDTIFEQLQKAPMLELQVPYERRLQNILAGYGNFPTEELETATKKLKKRLGDLKLRTAIDYLRQGDMESWCREMLSYYDKFYSHSMKISERTELLTINTERLSQEELVQKIQNTYANRTGNHTTHTV